MVTRTKRIPTDVRARVAELRREIERHNILYYVENASEITDAEYDALMREVLVVLIEPRHHLPRVRMLGTAVVEDDPHEAAVLDAVNRFITRPNGNLASARA